MALSDRQRVLYARQMLLSEVGAEGQERVIASRVALRTSGHAGARQAAEEGLARAGVALASSQADGLAIESGSTEAVEALAGDPLLEPAAALLRGSFAAVETLKGILSVGTPADFPSHLTLSSEDP